MTDELTYELGTYRGRRYILRGRAEPTDKQPEEFAVTVYYRNASNEESIEVARINTAHGSVHFDRLYHREQPKDDIDLGYWEAVTELMENWRTYAKNYENAHG